MMSLCAMTSSSDFGLYFSTCGERVAVASARGLGMQSTAILPRTHPWRVLRIAPLLPGLRRRRILHRRVRHGSQTLWREADKRSCCGPRAASAREASAATQRRDRGRPQTRTEHLAPRTASIQTAIFIVAEKISLIYILSVRKEALCDNRTRASARSTTCPPSRRRAGGW